MREQRVVQPLSPRQRDVLCLIARFWEVFGEPPPGRLIARRLGIDHQTLRQHLQALHAKGWLRHPSTGGIRCTHVPSER